MDTRAPGAAVTASTEAETDQVGGASRAGWAVAIAAFVLIVGVLPDLSTGPWPPKAAVLLVLGAAGIPILAWRAIGRGAARRTTAEMWAARAAVGFVVAAALATIGASRPLLAVVGLYQQGTGLVFVASIAGCWAVGTIVGPDDRRILITAIIAGAVVNSVVGILQVAVGLQYIGLPLYQGVQADGLLTNPVHLGALLAAALVLAAPRFAASPGSLWVVVAILGAGVGITGSRLPALMVLGVALWVLWRAWRADSTSPSQRGRGRRATLRTGVGFAGLSVGAVVAGSVLALVRGSSSSGVAGATAGSTVNETFGQRLSAWTAGLHALVDKPLLGAGPGQFRTATSALFPASFVRQNPDLYFTDAHNIVIEYAVTTGLLGAILLVAWLALSLGTKRGPLVGFAIVLLASGLIEPLDPVVTPLMMLALGAAALRPIRSPAAAVASPAKAPSRGSSRRQPGDPGTSGPPRPVRWASLALVGVASAAAVTFLIGDAALQYSSSQYSVAQDTTAQSAASVANDLLAPWPDPATQLGEIHGYLGLDVRFAAQKQQAISWRRQAVLRDPTNWILWTYLAQAQALNGELGPAQASALSALRWFPHDVATLTLLGTLAAVQHQPAAAHAWFGRALAVAPHNAGLRALYDGRCRPAVSGLRTSAIKQGCAGSAGRA